MAISQEELERRIKDMIDRSGRNLQGSATSGLNRRTPVNLGDILESGDFRRLGLGLNRPTPDESQDDLETSEETPPLQREPDLGAEDLGTTAGDAPAPTGEGVGIGPIAGLAKGAVIPALGNIVLGMSNPLFGKVAIAKLMYDSLQEAINPDISMTEDEAFEDINMDFQEMEDPVQFSEFSTDTSLDPDVNPEAYSEFSWQEDEGVGGTSGGSNIGGHDQGPNVGTSTEDGGVAGEGDAK